MGYFEAYKAKVDGYSIQTADQWNFNETEFLIRISREDWVIPTDNLQKIYSKCLDNRESLTSIEYINNVREDIPYILIWIGIQVLAFWFNNDLNDNIVVTTAKAKYITDCIFFQHLKSFHKFPARKQKREYQLLLMDSHRSYHIREFFSYCKEHKIVSVNLPLYKTHLL